MSWFRIDDDFTAHPKVIALSDAALAMWMKCGCWAQRPQNQYLGGLIPAALLPEIAKLPAKKARDLAKELVEANAGGTKEFGLWEVRENGWQFHDWDDYQPRETLTRAEAASLAGKKSAAVRRERNGTAQPSSNRTPPNDSQTFEERSTEQPSTNDSRTSRTPDPDPVCSSGSAHATTGGDIPCPPDLALSDEEFRGLSLGQPLLTREFVEKATPQIRVRFGNQPHRTLARWKNSLISALTSSCTNPAKRDELLGRAPSPKPERAGAKGIGKSSMGQDDQW